MIIANVNALLGHNVEILEMNLYNMDNRLELTWKLFANGSIFGISFYGVSRFLMEGLSAPLIIHGFEIIDNSQKGWDVDSQYEIRDFEYNCIHFYCQQIEIRRTGDG